MIIYVQQGRSARLVCSEAKKIGITGLYTDNFSCCLILVCVSDNKISLTHIDQRALIGNDDDIQRELEWFGAEGNIFLFFRPDTPFIDLFEKRFSTVTFTKAPLKSVQYDGILCSFAESEPTNGAIVPSGLPPIIHHYPREKSPLQLCSHPEGRRFEAVQKIKQIIGLLSAEKSQDKSLAGSKQLLIFDGKKWCNIPPEDLEITPTHKLMEEEMNHVIGLTKEDKSYIYIAGILIGIIEGDIEQGLKIEGDNSTTMGLIVASYMQDYLTEFKLNEETFFLQEIEFLIQYAENEAISKPNEKLLKKLRTILAKGTGSFETITPWFEELKSTPDDSIFKKSMLENYDKFSTHYTQRANTKKMIDEGLILQKRLAPSSEASERSASMTSTHTHSDSPLHQKAAAATTTTATTAAAAENILPPASPL